MSANAALPAPEGVTLREADLGRETAAILALNNAAVPAVNAIATDELAFYAAHGTVTVALLRGDLAGVLVLLPPRVPYDSANYAWFSARYDSFLYVDRVVVAPNAQGAGVGRALYGHALERAARESRAVVLSEVNTRPPNPGSAAFHARLGFRVLEERENPAAGKRVAMMECRVP